jgi:hypothetical protein
VLAELSVDLLYAPTFPVIPHAQTALRALHASRPDLVKRVRGLKANASPLSPEELDKLNHLAATDVQIWARTNWNARASSISHHSGWLLRNRRTLYRRFGQGCRLRRSDRPHAEKMLQF